MPKMHQDTFGDGARPGPAGGAYALPQTHWPRWGPTTKGDGRAGRRRTEGAEMEGKGIPPKVNVSRINTAVTLRPAA